MPVTPVSASPIHPAPVALHHHRRRRAHAPAMYVPSPLAQTLPLTVGVGARVHVPNPLVAPVVGAVLGTLLLGLPGTIIGGIAGWMLSH